MLGSQCRFYLYNYNFVAIVSNNVKLKVVAFFLAFDIG